MTIAPGAYDCITELEYLILNHPQKGFVLAFHFPIFGGAPRPAAASNGAGACHPQTGRMRMTDPSPTKKLTGTPAD